MDRADGQIMRCDSSAHPNVAACVVRKRVVDLRKFTRALEGGRIWPHLFSRIGASRRFYQTCLKFNNTSCVYILTS